MEHRSSEAHKIQQAYNFKISLISAIVIANNNNDDDEVIHQLRSAKGLVIFFSMIVDASKAQRVVNNKLNCPKQIPSELLVGLSN